jgi:hypothetical protein
VSTLVNTGLLFFSSSVRVYTPLTNLARGPVTPLIWNARMASSSAAPAARFAAASATAAA